MASTDTQTTRIVPEWTLIDRLIKARTVAGMDQGALAAALGVSASLVSKWEKGQREPRISVVTRVAAITGVDEQWLLAGVTTLRRKDHPAWSPQVIAGGRPDGDPTRGLPFLTPVR